MGAESKNPDRVSFAISVREFSPILSRANALTQHVAASTLGMFRLRAVERNRKRHLLRAPLNKTGLIKDYKIF